MREKGRERKRKREMERERAAASIDDAVAPTIVDGADASANIDGAASYDATAANTIVYIKRDRYKGR